MSNRNGKKTNYDLNESTDNQENKGNKIQKFIYSVVLFVPIFIAYYFVVGLVSMFPLYFIFGAESGGWAYGIILGFCLSPIFTIITIIKLIYKKNDN